MSTTHAAVNTLTSGPAEPFQQGTATAQEECKAEKKEITQGRTTTVRACQQEMTNGVPVLMKPVNEASPGSLDEAQPHTAQVSVSAQRSDLFTCTAAVFTPQSQDFYTAFHKASDMDVDALLQRALKQYTALSVGDWICLQVPSYSSGSTPGCCQQWCGAVMAPVSCFRELMSATVAMGQRQEALDSGSCTTATAQPGAAPNTQATTLANDAVSQHALFRGHHTAAQHWLQVTQLEPQMHVSLIGAHPEVEVRTESNLNAEMQKRGGVEQGVAAAEDRVTRALEKVAKARERLAALEAAKVVKQ